MTNLIKLNILNQRRNYFSEGLIKKNKEFKHVLYSIDNFTLDKFLDLIFNNFKLNSTYSILIKVSYEGNLIFKMCGNQIGLVIKNKHDVSYYKDLYYTIISRIEATTDIYNFNESISGIEIIYTTIETQPELRLKKITHVPLPKHLVTLKDIRNKFNNKFLPLTIDSFYFGIPLLDNIKPVFFNKINENNIFFNLKNVPNIQLEDEFFLYKEKPNKEEFLIVSKKLSDNTFIRYILNPNTCIIISTVKDIILNKNKFKRTINNVTLTIENSKVTDVNIPHKLKPITNNINRRSIIPERNNNFGTFDIETFVDTDGLSKVYALGFLSTIDSESNLFYLTDITNNNHYEFLVLTCINKMLINKYHNFIFYAHNFGRFDCIFIYNILKNSNIEKGFEYYHLKTTTRDDVIIKLEIKIRSSQDKNSKYIKISIVDSLNLLNNSLDKLTKDFNLDVKKGIFPYKFVNRYNLNYIGATPDPYYYNNITKSEYKDLYKDNWNLKQETLQYLDNDLKCHLNVMEEFSRILFIQFNVQMTEALTISRLALNIYLKRYLKETKLPLINQYSIFNFIKFGYYGGTTEVYKPYGKDLTYIDVNSLYPFAALNPMPGLNCTYMENFENKGLDLDNLFGFFYAKVKTNNNSYLGLLPVQTNKELIFPLGEFEGIWSSEELKFARDNGYKITVIKGYNFNKVYNAFDLYVKDLYHIKNNNTGTIKMVAKSLLNNLLGRFGLNIFKPITKSLNKIKRDFIASTRKIISQKNITDFDFLVTYMPIISKDICEEHGLDYFKVLEKESNFNIENNIDLFKDISITTAAFTTSYARIFMNKIKIDILKNGGEIYYTDTDSLVLDKKYLDKSWIGNKLGLFKIEYDIKEAYFISNKTYCLILKNGKTIIKTKGILSNSVQFKDFENMYLNKSNISAIKSHTTTNYEKGSVSIGQKNVNLNFDSYTKREKIYNDKGLWINTKPIYYNNIKI